MTKKKKLRKETFDDGYSNRSPTSGYIKEYDENGRIIKFSEWDFDDHYSSKFTYDNLNRIISESIDITRLYGTPSEKRKKNYEYIDTSYRVLEYKTQIIDDSRTTKQLSTLVTSEEYSAKYSRDVNLLLSVEDFTLNENGKIASKKVFNLIDNETTFFEYTYDNNLLLIKESIFELNKNGRKIVKKIIHTFNNDKKLTFKKTIEYHNQKPKVTEEYKYIYSHDHESRQIMTTLDKDDETDTSLFDYQGNILQCISTCDDSYRNIYINNYYPPDHELLESIYQVWIYEDSHELMSVKRFYYEI